MTPKQKAAYLMLSYMAVLGHKPDLAKQCALVAVKEMLTVGCIEVPYWLEVKQEIEEL
jgi:hypothetical protein